MRRVAGVTYPGQQRGEERLGSEDLETIVFVIFFTGAEAVVMVQRGTGWTRTPIARESTSQGDIQCGVPLALKYLFCGIGICSVYSRLKVLQ